MRTDTYRDDMTTQDRLTIADLDGINLRRGNHATRKDGVCVMEAAAWMAGERHSDRPKCVCPTIAAFMREWNDGLSDKDRDRLLKPLLPKVLDTRSTREVARRRSLLALDWFIRVYTPAWLALIPSLEQHVTALRSLAAIVDDDTAIAAIRALEAANSAVRSVYVPTDLADGSEALLYATMDSAAILAACSAAAGSVVNSTAWLVSRSAVFLASVLASRSAEVSEIAPIVTSLQQSASELVLRMIAVTD